MTFYRFIKRKLTGLYFSFDVGDVHPKEATSRTHVYPVDALSKSSKLMYGLWRFMNAVLPIFLILELFSSFHIRASYGVLFPSTSLTVRLRKQAPHSTASHQYNAVHWDVFYMALTFPNNVLFIFFYKLFDIGLLADIVVEFIRILCN